MRTKSIKEAAPRPSDAIKAMLAGLREIPDERFRVHMGTYGRFARVNGTCICYGCAATCAVHKLADKKPHADYIHMEPCQSAYLGFNYTDMLRFEAAIDQFRIGHTELLLFYYDLIPAILPSAFWCQQPWYLKTEDWQEQLPLIEEYVKKLEAAGF